MSYLGKTERARLQDLSILARRMIIEAAQRGGCFVGSAFSAVDIILYLYEHVLRGLPDDHQRDYFLLSKGHAVQALYSVLCIKGIINGEWINRHLDPMSVYYWHPNNKVSGVEAISGSLGHLPSVAAGIALDIKLRGGNNRVYVMLGDGELNEGSVWEALLFANAMRLDNLIVIIDRNLIQANMPTESLIPLEPLKDKFEAFGLRVFQVNGHDFDDLHETFTEVDNNNDTPKAVIAYTIRGKGLPSIENRIDRWFMKVTNEEATDLFEELRHLYADRDIVVKTPYRQTTTRGD